MRDLNPYAAPGAAQGYEAIRPPYPAQAVSLALEGDPRVIADVGAGTGRFSIAAAKVLPHSQIIAIEPSEEMRSSWPEIPQQVVVSGATAEHTQLPHQSCDRVVWAQSFHWIDPHLASVETNRILRDGGYAIVIANQMDVSQAWVHRLTRIMRSGDVYRPDRPPQLPRFVSTFLQPVAWVQNLRVDEVLLLARTRASYLRAKDATRAKMQENLRWYLLEHLGYGPEDIVEIPYFTYVWRLDPSST